MKRIFIMLLIACSAIATISADSTAPTAPPQKKPESVIATLNAIIYKFGQNEGQVYSVNRNPTTGIIESSTKIVPFCCPANDMKNDNVLKAVALNFQKEEPLSYQFLHIQPGSNENIQLKVITNNGESNGTLRIRTRKTQEMWLMCTKNPENPQLRDAYAITWEYMHDQKDQVLGTVYMITSLRPDMYEKSMSSKTFRIDGHVGDDLNDSLYVVYMADNAEELNNVADDDFVATMPVVNKRFNFSVEIDEPKVGRIRTVMPDGSLCELWTNLDFVPGETYHITTHNGWYEEDSGYENRVGRRSGKSLLNELQRQGIDDQTAVVTDDVPEEFRTVTKSQSQDWRNSLSPQQKTQLEMKVELMGMNIERIKAIYESVVEETKGMNSGYKVQMAFDQIVKQNKELDKKYQEIIQLAKSFGVPTTGLLELYKEIIKFYAEQNQRISEINKYYGAYTKQSRKAQKCVNDLMEKYRKEMTKALE